MAFSTRDEPLTNAAPARRQLDQSAGLSIREVRPLDQQTVKLVVEGRPISADRKLSVAQVFDFYRKLAETKQANAVEASLQDFLVADAPAESK